MLTSAVRTRGLHKQVRFLQNQIKRVDARIEDIDLSIVRFDRGEESEFSRDELVRSRELLFAQRQEIVSKVPSEWEAQNAAYVALLKDDKMKVNQYRRNVDDGYRALVEVRNLIADTLRRRQHTSLRSDADRLFQQKA